jgi:hypothetical protein
VSRAGASLLQPRGRSPGSGVRRDGLGLRAPRAGLLLLALAGAGVALAAKGPRPQSDLPDVVRTLSDDSVVNWSRARLEVTTVARDARAAVAQPALEQAAVDALDVRLPVVAEAFEIAPGVRLGDIGPRLSEEVRRRWSLLEVRYATDRSVTAVGGLDLAGLAAPWMQQRAADPPAEPREGATGLLVDARGLGATPVYAPRVVGPGGEVLMDGVLWADAVFRGPPAVWVGDPAHPGASAAGPAPVLVTARAYDAGALTVDETAAARIRDGLFGTRALREGRLVVVVEP